MFNRAIMVIVYWIFAEAREDYVVLQFRSAKRHHFDGRRSEVSCTQGSNIFSVCCFCIHYFRSSPSSADLPQLTLPDDEEQLFTPKTKKNMTEVEALPTPEKAEQSTPPSKRSLDFAAAQSGDAPLPTHPSNASSASTNEPADVHKSPAKKGKEKQVSK